MKNTISLVFFLMLATMVQSQQKVVPLYQGKAPGSESWTWQEQSSDKNAFGTKVVYNVVEPTLTVFPAQGAINTGTAVVIAPGGGLFSLSVNSEGNDVAEWLSKKGVTAFVLKYRLVRTSDPVKEFMASMVNRTVDSLIKPIAPLAMTDGLMAIAYIRKNADAFNVNPNRIGFMGFSAGGGVTMSVAYNATDENRPNFIAPIYTWDKNIIAGTTPVAKMPAFIVVASDDQLGLAPTSMDIYKKWIAAKQVAQLFIYQNGGHGFGMKKQDKLTDSWNERFEEWLAENGLLWPEKPTGMLKGVTYKMVKKFTADQEEQLRTDWANRKRYAEANVRVAASQPGKHRVVFMGNSITELWKVADSNFFNSNAYINRGISGQTSSQMLVRFRDDVIALKPTVMVILAGINDIAENTGPIPLEGVFGNIVSMVELAKANKIKVVLSSLLPANVIPWRSSIKPADKIEKLNGMLKTYAEKNKIVFVDYYPYMVDDRKGLKTEYTNDGVHPTLPGYKVMEPLVEQAIHRALKQQK